MVDRKRIADRRDLNRIAFEMLLRDEKSGVRETMAKDADDQVRAGATNGK